MELDLARVVAGLGFLLVAAAMDLRRRTVKDEVWVAMGVIALGFVEIDLLVAGAPPALHGMTAATAILYFSVFFGEPLWDDDDRFHARPLRIAAYALAPLLVVAAWRWSSDDATLGSFYRLLTMPGMIVIAHGLYYFGLLRGGADAKALMALALLVPGFYPHIGPLPLLRVDPIAEPLVAVTFPFAFVVLLNSALLFLVLPLAFLVRNAARGNAKLPRGLFGFRVPLDRVPRYAWFMDRIEDGRPAFVYFPPRKEDREEQVRLLREHGFTHVWVTPQIPFVVAMLIGFALAVVFGNLLLAAFGGFGG